jgi:hypothetical protein
MIQKLKSYREIRLLGCCLFSLITTFLFNGCAGFSYHFGSEYKGRVVDQKTGEPVAGVVVVGSWTYVIPSAGGGTTRCRDAREAVTDDKGEFGIPNISYGEFSIAIYKVGYERVECGWHVLDEKGSCYLEHAVDWVGDRAIFPLSRLSRDQLDTFKGSPPNVSCGRKDGKSLSAWLNERKKYYETLSK